MPMALFSQRPAAEKRAVWLFRPLELGCRRLFRKSHPKRTRFSPPRLESSHAQKALSELTNFSDRLLGRQSLVARKISGLAAAFAHKRDRFDPHRAVDCF